MPSRISYWFIIDNKDRYIPKASSFNEIIDI